MKTEPDVKQKWPTLEDRLNNPLTTRKEALEQLSKVMQLSETAEKELKKLKKKQPIFVVSREKVLAIIDRWTLFQALPESLYWGKLKSKEELFDAVNKLKIDEQGRIDMSRLAQCLQQFHTSKMGGFCNYALQNVWNQIKRFREAI